MRALLVYSICILHLLVSLPALGARGELPDIGSSAESVLSRDREYQIGRMIVRGLRDSGQLLQDPEINEYVQSIGHRISANAHDGEHKFSFFVVRSPAINAFALPGGFIGVNTGLILASTNESELAGVLAHEIAHVTQRHIARQVEAAGRINLMSAAALLAAILIGAASGSSDATTAGMMAAQSAAVQSQINFTRANEYEADRIGIGLLANSGFDPHGMPSFFETLASQAGTLGSAVPELLRTHPVTTNRIAESRDRALREPQNKMTSSLSYQLARARIRVLSAASPQQALERFTTDVSLDHAPLSQSMLYGRGLALLEADRPQEAETLFAALLAEHPGVIEYHIARAQAQIRGGGTEQGLATFQEALDLFPRNVPLTYRYSEALLHGGNASRAHELMLDLLNNIDYNPDQLRLIAMAANAAGDSADAHYYMSEFHVLNGELALAVNQLEFALATPGIADYQRARYQARLELIRQHIPEERRRAPRPTPEGQKR